MGFSRAANPPLSPIPSTRSLSLFLSSELIFFHLIFPLPSFPHPHLPPTFFPCLLPSPPTFFPILSFHYLAFLTLTSPSTFFSCLLVPLALLALRSSLPPSPPRWVFSLLVVWKIPHMPLGHRQNTAIVLPYSQPPHIPSRVHAATLSASRGHTHTPHPRRSHTLNPAHSKHSLPAQYTLTCSHSLEVFPWYCVDCSPAARRRLLHTPGALCVLIMSTWNCITCLPFLSPSLPPR